MGIEEAKALGGWVIAGLLSIVAFFLKRAIKGIESDIADNEERIAALEKEMMTKAEVKALYEAQKEELKSSVQQLREDQKELRKDLVDSIKDVRTDQKDLRKEMMDSLNRINDSINTLITRPRNQRKNDPTEA